MKQTNIASIFVTVRLESLEKITDNLCGCCGCRSLSITAHGCHDMDTSLFFKVSVHIARAGTPAAEAFDTERSHSSEDLFENILY